MFISFVRTMMLGGCLLCAMSANAGWSAGGRIINVYSHDGRYFIDTAIAANACGQAGRFWWPGSDPDAKDMYAMALVALVAGKSVAVVYNEAAPSCDNDGALVTHMVVSE